MPRTASARRLRRGAGLLLLLLSGVVLVSLKRVGDSGATWVVEGRLPAEPAHLAAPGWYLAFPGLRRLTRYPTEPQSLEFHWPPPGGPRIASAEGSRVRVEGSIEFRIPPSAALQLHPATRGEIGSRLLLPELERVGREEIRSTSFSRMSGAHRIELEARLDARLGPWMRSRGLVLRSLRVDSVRLADAPAGAGRPIPGARVLLIGLDGADWNVLDPLLAAGRLPTLSRLIEGGARARLESIDPPISPVVWTTVATGFLPSRHGILDFVVADRRNGAVAPVTSRQRRVRAIWNILSESGVPVGVIGWWATWPAEFVDGYIVSDRVAYQLPHQAPPSGEAGKTFPPDLFSRIRPLVVSPEQVPESVLRRFIDLGPAGDTSRDPEAERIGQFRTVLASTESYEAIATALDGGRRQPFQAIYFEGIDTTSHLFMPFRPPRRETIDPGRYARFSRSVDEFYVYQDEVLGRLLRGVPPETNILVISDHGFKSAADRPARESRVEFGTAALWHRRHGVLIASGPAFRKGVRIADASVVDITPTLLALFGLPVGEDMAGRPIPELLTAEFLAAHPVGYRPSWESGAAVAQATDTSDPEGDRALRDKLVSLGYLSQSGGLPRNNLGNSLLAEGKVDQAIAEFQSAIAESPRLPLLHINLARAQLMRGNFPAARRELDRALRLDPASAEAQVLLANLELREGRTLAAEERLRAVLRQDPAASGAHRSLGSSYQARGETRKAEEEYRLALEVDPDDAESLNNLGVLRQQAGLLEEADSYFQEAIAVHPDFAAAYNNLALVAMEREDWERADRLLSEGLSRAGDDPVLLNNRGNLEFNRNRSAEAESAYRRAIAGNAAYAEPHNGMGTVLAARGDAAGAAAEFDAALRIKPDYPDAQLNRGRLRETQGDGVGAERDFRAILSRHSGHPAASRELARLLIQRGSLPEAEKIIRESLKTNDSDAGLWTILGRCLTLKGQPAEAIRSYRRALTQDPGQEESRRMLERLGGLAP